MQRVILGQCQAGKVIVYCDVVRPGEVVVCGLVRPVKDGPADNILQNLYSPLCVPKISVYCCFHNTIVGRCTEKCETIKNTGLKKKKKNTFGGIVAQLSRITVPYHEFPYMYTNGII